MNFFVVVVVGSFVHPDRDGEVLGVQQLGFERTGPFDSHPQHVPGPPVGSDPTEEPRPIRRRLQLPCKRYNDYGLDCCGYVTCGLEFFRLARTTLIWANSSSTANWGCAPTILQKPRAI